MSENKNNPALKVITTEFRVSYPHLFKPSQIKGSDKENYSLEMLFDKDLSDLADIKKAVLAAVVGKWGNDKTKWPQPLLLPYRDGDKPHGKKRETKKDHANKWVVRASSSAEYERPFIVGLDPSQPIIDEADFYAGCYARASVKAFAYSFADKDGVKLILDGVQFIKHGDRIGGRKPASEIFGVLEDTDGDIDLSGQAETNEVEESFL